MVESKSAATADLINRYSELSPSVLSLRTLNNSRRSEQRLCGIPYIYPTDDGGYEVGLDGPAFPSRAFAESVVRREVLHATS
jgi:hypothetical protein